MDSVPICAHRRECQRGTDRGAAARRPAQKDSGLTGPLADAINHLIGTGQYKQWLDAWHLGNEAVAKSEVNPPGLPLTNT